MLGMNLGDLNGIGRGVDKRWIYKDDLACELAHDYLQKINYSIQDINNLLCENGQIEKRTDVIATIVMTDWIVESVRGYKSCLLPNLLDNFCFSRQEDLQKSHSFIKGIRSFIVAHPLDTNRHEKFGFDGDAICVDLRSGKPVSLRHGGIDAKRIGINGIEEYDAERDGDLYLFTYSKRTNAKFFRFLVIDFMEVIQIGEIYIEQLYEIDRYLRKLRKKDYIAK